MRAIRRPGWYKYAVEVRKQLESNKGRKLRSSEKRLRRLFVLKVVLGLAAIGGIGAAVSIYGDKAMDQSKALVEALPDTKDLTGLVVDKIELTGVLETPMRDIRQAVQVGRGDSMVSIDVTAIRKRLEAIGWVKSATVTRHLPNTLSVRVVERRPLAVWQNHGVLKLIGRDGVVITGEHMERFRDLPQVVGEGAAKRVSEIITLLDSDPDLARQFEAAIRVGDRRWDILLVNGIRIRLPEYGYEKAWSKLARLDRDEKILSRAVTAIDMRLADKMILTLTPEASAIMRTPGQDT